MLRSRTVLVVVPVVTLAVASLALAQMAPNDALMSAIAADSVGAAQQALAAGADVNLPAASGMTPVAAAAFMSRPHVLTLLLDRGGDPGRASRGAMSGNAVSVAFSGPNGVALLEGDEELRPGQRVDALAVLSLLIAKKVNLNESIRRGPTDRTPLMLAAEAGARDVVELLLGGGADPNAKNGGGYTALDLAVDRAPVSARRSRPAERLAIVKALLAAGARTDRAGADRVRPLDRARSAGDAAIVAALAAAGAK